MELQRFWEGGKGGISCENGKCIIVREMRGWYEEEEMDGEVCWSKQYIS